MNPGYVWERSGVTPSIQHVQPIREPCPHKRCDCAAIKRPRDAPLGPKLFTKIPGLCITNCLFQKPRLTIVLRSDLSRLSIAIHERSTTSLQRGYGVITRITCKLSCHNSCFN